MVSRLLLLLLGVECAALAVLLSSGILSAEVYALTATLLWLIPAQVLVLAIFALRRWWKVQTSCEITTSAQADFQTLAMVVREKEVHKNHHADVQALLKVMGNRKYFTST